MSQKKKRGEAFCWGQACVGQLSLEHLIVSSPHQGESVVGRCTVDVYDRGCKFLCPLPWVDFMLVYHGESFTVKTVH